MKTKGSKRIQSWIFLFILLILTTTRLFSQEKNQVEDLKKRGLELKHHQDKKGVVRDDLYRKSFADFMRMKNGIGAQITSSSQWKMAGPAPSNVNASISLNGQLPGPNAGSVMDIAIDPSGSADQTVYIASEEGGIWKTVNGGASWFPLTDTLQTLSFGAVALDPSNSNIIYAGTGNIFNQGYYYQKNGKIYKAVGIYVSRDGGISWKLAAGSATLNGIGINRIVVPSSGVLVVATSNGLFRSTDGGNSFSQVSLGGVNNLYITDLDMQDGNSNNIWASAHGTGIFYSSNQGQSFGSNLWTNTNGGPTVPYRFVSMGASSNGQTLYANAELNRNGLTNDGCYNLNIPGVGVWKSTNNGATWTNISQNANRKYADDTIPCWRQINNCQCGYDQTMGVDPGNSNRVYMGFQDMWISEDGGNSWYDATLSFAPRNHSKTELMHVDHHALTFSPASHRSQGQPVGIWVGNDGGVWNSTNNGVAWNVRNKGTSADSSLATQLFRHIDMGRGSGNNAWTYGGTQDDGTSAGNPTITSPGWTQTWNEWLGGDGSFTATDWQNPRLAYGSWGSPDYTNNGGASMSWPYITCSSGSPKYYSVIRVGPQNRCVYLGGHCNDNPALFVSTNLGQSYSSKYIFSSSIASIAVSASDSNLIYVGCDNGSINKMRYANGVVTLTSSSSVPNASGSSPQLAINPSNSQMVVAVYTGYSNANLPSRHVFLSMNGGGAWKDISGFIAGANVPDMPIYSVVIDPHTTPNSILVSGDFGVMRSFDYGLTWHVLGTNLPNTHAVDMALDPLVNPSVVKVGTFGRSIWSNTLDVGTYVFGMLSEKFTPNGNILIQNNSSDTLYVYDEFNPNSKSYLIARQPPNVADFYGQFYFSKVVAIKDKAGNIVLVYPLANGSQNQAIYVSQAAVDAAKSNQLKNYPGIKSYPVWRQVNNFYVYNNSSIPIYLYWIDGNGISQSTGDVVNAGANTVIGPVSFGGTFTATDANGRLIGIYVASDAPNQSFTITNEMVNFWKN